MSFCTVTLKPQIFDPYVVTLSDTKKLGDAYPRFMLPKQRLFSFGFFLSLNKFVTWR